MANVALIEPDICPPEESPPIRTIEHLIDAAQRDRATFLHAIGCLKRVRANVSGPLRRALGRGFLREIDGVIKQAEGK